MLESYNDVSVGTKLEIIGDHSRVILLIMSGLLLTPMMRTYLNLVVICATLFEPSKVPYALASARFEGQSHSQVTTYLPVDVTIVFSASFTPVLNLGS
jgi:hypothetical protein